MSPEQPQNLTLEEQLEAALRAQEEIRARQARRAENIRALRGDPVVVPVRPPASADAPTREPSPLPTTPPAPARAPAPTPQVPRTTGGAPKIPDQAPAEPASKAGSQAEKTPADPVEAKIKKEIQKFSKPEREKVGWGINNIGFKIERAKNDWFAGKFAWISQKFDRRSKISRFARAVREKNIRAADVAQKKAKAGKEKGTGKLTKLSNAAYLAKNFVRPARILADLTGLTPTGIQRYLMIASMAAASLTGAAKETRFLNEELLEKTRMDDVKKATEEAWKIYERAEQAKINKDPWRQQSKSISADELKTAYLREIPEDLKQRLQDPKTANMVVKDILGRRLKSSVETLNKKIENIESNKKLSPEQKERQIEQLLRRWERRLTDYDRALTRLGTVDGWAMAGHYAETISKTAVRAVTLESLYLVADKAWEEIAHALTDSNTAENAGNLMPPPKASGDVTSKKTLEKLLSQQGPASDIPTKAESITTQEQFDKLFSQQKSAPVDAVQADSVQKVAPDSVRADSLNTSGADSLQVKPDTVVPQTDTLKTLEKVDSAKIAILPAVEAPLVEPAQSALEIGKPLTHSVEFSIEKGSGGLEHTYEKLVLDRYLPEKLPDGIVLDQNGATRTLNEAANLVRLTEEHNTAGITAAEFRDAVKFENGVLHITNPDKFNDIVTRLHQHSQELLDKGVFKDPDSATGYIKNVNWLEKVQANDMHATYEDIGHPEATANQIVDFSKIPNPHRVDGAEAVAAQVDEARAKVFEDFKGAEEGMSKWEPLQVRDMTPSVEGELKNFEVSPINGEQVVELNASVERTTGLHIPLSGEILNQRVGEVYGSNLNLIFKNLLDSNSPENARRMIDGVLDQPARQLMENAGSNAGVAEYFRKIREVLGANFQPKEGPWFFQGPETTGEYIKRALKEAGKTRLLYKLKL
ncbi:MAG: hypothetical protein Q8O46_01375 [bacterium]|nr:hypothetical protein [bacterium]